MSRRKPRKPVQRGPLPVRSARIYLRLAPRDIALCRFLLEARDNLGYLTVLDRSAAVLELVHSPGQAREVREALAEMAEVIPFALLDQVSPAAPGRAGEQLSR